MTLVVLDAGVLIGALDGADAHHQASVTALSELHRDDLVLPASVLAEVLVRPYSRGPAVVQTVERFVSDVGARIYPLDAPCAHAAARLRASHPSLRLPDALTLGTATILGGTVLTTDAKWPAELEVSIRLVGP